MSEKNIHWSKINEVATPGKYRRACSSQQWIKEMQTSTENAGKKQGSNVSKIRNAGPRMDTFLTINEEDPSQRGTKRKLLIWRLSCIPGQPQTYLGYSEYTKAIRSHLVRYSGIEAAVPGLYRGLAEHHRPEQGSYAWLGIVLNDKTLIKNRRCRKR